MINDEECLTMIIKLDLKFKDLNMKLRLLTSRLRDYSDLYILAAGINQIRQPIKRWYIKIVQHLLTGLAEWTIRK